MKSYLADRKQMVFCNDVCSQYCFIKSGVPQGSILGPILFLVYINDIINSNNAYLTMYADDTSFIVSDQNLQNLHMKLSQTLEDINRWIEDNKLKLNVKKTHVMLFQNRSQTHNLHTLKLGNNVVQRVKSTKFLGVIVDEHFNWNEHIASVGHCPGQQVSYTIPDELLLRKQ